MNRQADHDAVVRRWLDEGPDAAPERFVLAALHQIETSGQRHQRWALPGRHTMTIHRLAIYAASAAVGVLAFVGLTYFAGSRAPGADQGPSASVTAQADLVEPEQLEAITLDQGPGTQGEDSGIASIHGPSPQRVLGGEDALVALLPAGTSGSISDGFTAARYVEFSGPLLNDPRTRASLATYVALFETEEDARRAYAVLVDAHASPAGWDLEEQPAMDDLGSERVQFAGPAYQRGESLIYLWLQRNAVLAAVAWDDTSPLLLLDVARRMDSWTHRGQ